MNTPRLLLALLGLALLPRIVCAQTPLSDEERALEVLRRTVQEREQRAEPTGAQTNLTPETIYSLMEKRYLDGKITAKQFQRFIRQHKSAALSTPTAPPVAAATGAATNNVSSTNASATAAANTGTNATVNAGTNAAQLAKAIEMLRAHDPKQPNPGPAQNPLGVISTNDLVFPPDDGFTDLEAKMNDLLRKKNERDRLSDTNAIPIDPSDPAQPMTKRQRLDALLKLLIEGKIADPDYQAKRNKVLALPD